MDRFDAQESEACRRCRKIELQTAGLPASTFEVRQFYPPAHLAPGARKDIQEILSLLADPEESDEDDSVPKYFPH